MAKVTDALLKEGSFAASGDETKALSMLSDLQERHEVTAIELLVNSERLITKLAKLTADLQEVLHAVSALRELTPRTSDPIASFGERLSIELVAAALREGGIPSEVVDSQECILTDDN